MAKSYRAHGTGTLVKRGKYWSARWMSKGKVYTRTTGCAVKADAQKKLEEFTKPFRETTDLEVLENLSARVRVAESAVKETANKKVPPIRIKFLVDVYKKDVNSEPIKPGTETYYESIVNVFEEAVKKQYAYEVTKEDVEKYLTGLKSRVGASRYNGALNSLRHMFDVAMKADYRIRRNPFDGFAHMKGDKLRTRRELTSEEVKALIEAAYEAGDEMGLLFEIGAYTGLRRSDCIRLSWSNVDFERKLISIIPVKTEKTGAWARIPLHPKLAERFKAMKRDPSGFILPKFHAMGITKVKYLICDVFKAAGVETSRKDANGKLKVITGFHALRHYFISQCVKSGIPISVVQKMVAHSSADMSLAYTHTFDKDLQLPDFDNSHEKVVLEKKTVEALNKARGVLTIDEFIMKLLEGKPTTTAHIKTQQEMELDKALDELFPA